MQDNQPELVDPQAALAQYKQNLVVNALNQYRGFAFSLLDPATGESIELPDNARQFLFDQLVATAKRIDPLKNQRS